MEDLKNTLLAYIKSLSHYEISRFLQFYPQLVEDAEYFVENTPVSVTEDTSKTNETELISDLLMIVEKHKIAS